MPASLLPASRIWVILLSTLMTQTLSPKNLGIESLNTARGSRRHDRLWLLCLLFFLSGFPALIYQIVWQRALFTIYGVNIESVTMVVTGFMLGLGLGSLLGGELSKRPLPLVALFGVAELGISFLGLASLRIFHLAALYTAGASQLQTGLISLLLVLLPTLLMGCTLPLLVTHSVRLSGSVGGSVAGLYFANTMGSAVACFAAAGIPDASAWSVRLNHDRGRHQCLCWSGRTLLLSPERKGSKRARACRRWIYKQLILN